MAASREDLQSHLADRYRIERELGRGGMGTVYLAEDLKHHRRVAIKVLEPELAAALGRERFLREIETVARLSHPHILPLHDSGEAGGVLYYVMPYVEGESLQARLAREKQLPLDDALKIAREVADALAFAHGHGVVHRDIKPGNILLQGGHAVVADFGLARAMAAAADPAAPTGAGTLTAPGSALGTPAYMSPEQAAGSRDVDGRSDLYSLGCVLYEMLTGQPPFTGPTVESLVHQHLSVAPRPVTDLRPAVPGWVAVAVQRALAKNPADRFSPVTLFGEALAHGEAANVTAAVPAVPKRRALSWQRLAAIGAAVAVVATGAWFVLRTDRKAPAPPPAAPAHERSAIAVLPFQNLSAEGPNAYFAGGLHDELLTQLSKVAALKVISRTSVMGYAGTTKSLKQVADELGVGSIVEGSVQVVGGRLRVNVQLIDAATDEHLWAEHYDRTLDDAFAIQSDVAQQVVAAVGVALSGPARQGFTEASTNSAEAYRLYLQGRDFWNRPGMIRHDIETAQRLFERAIEMDPSFALAHAALSEAHFRMYWYKYDPSPARAARQLEEARIAMQLAPGLPRVHVAMGLVHYLRREYPAALAEFATVLDKAPNDAEAWWRVGIVHRRLGHWQEVFEAFEKATRLNPRDANLFWDLGGLSFNITHRYAEAVRAYDEALMLAPDLLAAAVHRGWAYARWQGQLDSIRTTLDRLPRDAELGDLGRLAGQRAILNLAERDAAGVLEAIGLAPTEVFVSQIEFRPRSLYAGWAHRLRGDEPAARASLGAALAYLDATSRDLPRDWRFHSARGMSLAGLGRRSEALREVQWLRQSVEYRRDAFIRALITEECAVILAQAGMVDEVLPEVERLLTAPSLVSIHILRLDPRWDPIREDPRFGALLAKYAAKAS